MDFETLEKAVLAINELLKTQKGINETNETRIAWLEEEVKNLKNIQEKQFPEGYPYK